jgi:hypothetical protein
LLVGAGLSGAREEIVSKLVMLAAAAALTTLAAAPATAADTTHGARHHARHHHHHAVRHHYFGRPYYNYGYRRKPYYAVSCNYRGWWFTGWETSCYGPDYQWYWPP